MPVPTAPRDPAEKPGALELAIREWQRQLVDMASAAKRAEGKGLVSQCR